MVAMSAEKWRALEKLESAQFLIELTATSPPVDKLRDLLKLAEAGDAAMQAVLNEVFPSLGVMVDKLLQTSLFDAKLAIAAIEDAHRPLRLTIALPFELEDMG